MSENKDNIIELVDEEGNVFSFTLVEAFEVEGKRYAVLLPNGEDTDEALVLKVEVDENGEECLYEIDNDEEWDTVMQVWEALAAEE
ncbi:MAG TPA: DUF1292 domain-containing protein [Clostridia bacterium]|nr:DUF1292 domain-containing protein [Clostridia bacterium]